MSTTLSIESIVPKHSWWTDIKGRTWVITGYTVNGLTGIESQVEMLQYKETVPVYVPVIDVLKSIDNKQMNRLK